MELLPYKHTDRQERKKKKKKKKEPEEGGEEGEEDESAADRDASEEAETPLGTAFTCSSRPTAEYCRRLVVMETGRQSQLFVELWRNEAPRPLPPLGPTPLTSPPSPPSTPPFVLDGHRSQDRKPRQ